MEDILLVVFYFALFIQAFLFLYLFPSILFHQAGKSDSIKSVSIIIAAHNEKQNLSSLVPLLLRQIHPDFEIIIALDRSTDGSEELLKSFKNDRIHLLNVQNIPEGYNSKKYALTQAIGKSQKEWLLLTDADCIPASEEWISKMTSTAYAEKNIVLGYSPYLKEEGFLNLFIRFETFLTAIQYLSFAIKKLPYMGVGRNLAYSRNIFLKDGFKGMERLTGGDDDLFVGKVATGNNTTICIEKKAFVYSIPKQSWKDYFYQKKRHLAAGTRYSTANKIKSALVPLSQILLFFSFLPLITLNPENWPLWGIFIWRTLVIIVIFALIARKLGENIKWFWFPVLDLSYLISFIVNGIPAAFTRNKIKWK